MLWWALIRETPNKVVVNIQEGGACLFEDKMTKMTTGLSLCLLLIACAGLISPSEAAPIGRDKVLPPNSREKSSINVDGGFSCELCKVFAAVLETFMEKNSSEEEVVKLVRDFCILAKIEDELVCDQIAVEYRQEVLTIAYHIFLGQSEQACAILVGPTCAPAYDPWQQLWNISVPGNKPPIHHIQPPEAGSPVLRILHLSDIHWDMNYTAGLSNDCGEPICCRPPNKPGNGSSAAGPWGDFHCDLPYQTLISLMQYLSSIRDQFDIVYNTGDLPAHNVWNQTRKQQLFVLNTITSLLKQFLRDKKVYSTFGNHEGVPCNSFPPPNIRDPKTGAPALQWLLDGATQAWKQWLSQAAVETFEYAGYYSQKVSDGLRVISLQTNFGNSENFWLLINNTDPGHQLEWLVEELLDAERVGDKVHIIGHIPPSQFTHSLGWNYHSIVNRFESTIAGQFFGHTHKDEFQVFFDDSDKTRATSIVLICPSITTDDSNPGFRIYTVDGDYPQSSHVVLDYTSYYFNITAANLLNKSIWQQEYSAKDAFGMSSLLPADWADLVERFQQDDALFQQYYRYKYKLHPPTPTCSASCKASTLCSMLTSRTGDHSECSKFLKGGITMGNLQLEMARMRGKC